MYMCRFGDLYTIHPVNPIKIGQPFGLGSLSSTASIWRYWNHRHYIDVIHGCRIFGVCHLFIQIMVLNHGIPPLYNYPPFSTKCTKYIQKTPPHTHTTTTTTHTHKHTSPVVRVYIPISLWLPHVKNDFILWWNWCCCFPLMFILTFHILTVAA